MFDTFAEVGLTLVAMVAGYLFWTWPATMNCPGPKPLPYFGCIFYLMRHWDTLPEFCHENTSKYSRDGGNWGGPLPSVGLLAKGMVILVMPESVKHVLNTNFANYVKGKPLQDALEEFLGDGIFASDGAIWKAHRKVASNMFSRRLMREGCKIALKHTNTMLGWLKENPSKSGQSVDMQGMYFRLTMDVFTEIAFGVDLQSITRDEPHPFATAFDDIQDCSEKRFSNPLWRICRLFGLNGEIMFDGMGFRFGEKTIKEGTKVVNQFSKEVIASKRRLASEGATMGPDLLSRFLDTKEDDGEEMSDKELRDVVMNFMIAGRDTTACALSWTLFELADKPEVQEKIRAELVQVCGDEIDAPTFEQVAELRYMHAVAMEVLRLHPSVPKDVKFAVKDDVLPDGTKVPAGATVIYCPYAMGRNPDIWDDPLEFKPERFLGQPEPSPYKYPAFNAGPRLCLGKPLAMLEIKLITSLFLHNFEYSVAKPHAGGYRSTLVLPMEPGFEVNVTRRDTSLVSKSQ